MQNNYVKWGIRHWRDRANALTNEVVSQSWLKTSWQFHRISTGWMICQLWLALSVSGLFSAPGTTSAATKSPKLPVTPKWGRFEEAFTSAITYTNPLQEATITVQFTSPLGETNQVNGFWDGGRTWRVRFAPDQPGHWTFVTTCSDTGNTGLNGQHGEFLCTSTIGESRFRRHGPVRVA